MKKIKIIRDIPGYKAGETLEFDNLGLEREDNHRKACYPDYRADILIADGFAEEFSEIDMEEIRRTAWQDKHVAPRSIQMDYKSLDFYKAYRIVSAVIRQLNGEWEPEWNDILEFKWKIFLDKTDGNKFFISSNSSNMETIIPYMKDKPTAEKVIELCEPELKVLFGVK